MIERMVRDRVYLYPSGIGYESSLRSTAECVQELIGRYGPDATWTVDTYRGELTIEYERPETALEQQKRERLEQQERERKRQQKKIREAERVSLSARCVQCQHSRLAHHKKHGCTECPSSNACTRFVEPESV